jgi:hypothetical protein
MAWTKIEGETLQRLQNLFELPPPSTIVEAASMETPFYTNGELVKLSDGLHTAFMVAAGPGDLSTRAYYPLRGPGGDIHAANEAAGLVITPDNVMDYVWFFLTFLESDDGEPFAIIETLNGYTLVDENNPHQRKPQDMRLVCEGQNATGDLFAFHGYMAHHRHLFNVSLEVSKNGFVEMLDDDPMGEIVRLH